MTRTAPTTTTDGVGNDALAISTGTITPATYAVNANVLEQAVDHAVAAAGLFQINERTAGIRLGSGQIQTIDLRMGLDPLEDYTVRDAPFVAAGSLVDYVNRFRTDDTLGYVRDLTGKGIAALTAETPAVITYVIDEHTPAGPARRAHRAHLTLRPTPAATRWGKVLAGTAIDQEALLDLVVDGIGEIAAPPAAELRDLVSDLHAVRNTSARSVIRTGGGATLEVADNVTLHGGTGNRVTIPETITITFAPFTATDRQIVLVVKVKPIVTGEAVTFKLTAPELDTQLRIIVAALADDVGDGTGIAPLWVP